MPLISDPTLIGKRGRYNRTAKTSASLDPTRSTGSIERGDKHLVPGISQENPANSQKAIFDAYPDAPSGAYWFNFDSNQAAANTFQVYMLNEVDGGGWLLAGQSNYSNTGNRSGETSHPFHRNNAWWGNNHPSSTAAGIQGGIDGLWHPNRDVGTRAWGWMPMKECLIAACIPGSETRGVIYRFQGVTSSNTPSAGAHCGAGTQAAMNHDFRKGRNPYSQSPYWYTGSRSDTTLQPLGSAVAGFNVQMDSQPHGHLRLGSGQSDADANQTGMGLGGTYGYQLFGGHQWGFGYARNSSLWGSNNHDEWCHGVSLWIR